MQRPMIAVLAIVMVALAAMVVWADPPASDVPAKAPASAPAAAPATAPVVPLVLTFPACKELPAAEGLTEDICAAAMDWFDRADGYVDKLVPVAEAAAGKLLAGGTLWVGGNDGLADEADFRAGGFPFAKIWSGENLEENDVLIAGAFAPNEMHNRYAHPNFLAGGNAGRRLEKGMVIWLAGHDWPQVARALPMISDRFWGGRLAAVDTGATTGASMKDRCLGMMSTTALMWVLHGETVAAATRRGKTLATYASDFEPNGPAWDKTVMGKHEHPSIKLDPIPAGKIGREYLKTCRAQVAEFAKTQPGQIRLAAGRMAAAMKADKCVWAVVSGHVLARGASWPEDMTNLIMFGRSYDWRYTSQRIPAGDVLLHIGYLRYPGGDVKEATSRGVDVVVVTVDHGPTNEHVTHIDSCWKNYDTVIDLPKYPIRILPSSGVVQAPQWYALMAETAKAMKAGK